MDILWLAFEIFVNIFENAVICYFIQKHFPGRFSPMANRLINVATVMIIAGVYTVNLYLPSNWFVEATVTVLYWLSYTTLSRKGAWNEKSYWCVLLVSVTSICSVVLVTWGMYITGLSQSTIVFGIGMVRLLLIVSAKTMQCITLRYFSKLYVNSHELNKKIYIPLLLLPVFSLFIDTTLMYIGLAIGDDPYSSFYLAIATSCVMATLMISYYLHYKISTQSQSLLKAQSELQQKSLIEQHNDELLKIEANMRAWRHDFHNHLQSIFMLSRTGDREKLEIYIERLGHQLREVEGACHTGQQALDAIVTVKYALAKADGIVINLNIKPIAPLPINDVDVSSLLGNLFDNAIESCRKVESEKRSIDFSLCMMENMICIRMSNTTDGLVRVENGRYLTTKENENFHGMGLTSIDRIINAVGGLIQREHSDGLFTTVLLLPKKN